MTGASLIPRTPEQDLYSSLGGDYLVVRYGLHSMTFGHGNNPSLKFCLNNGRGYEVVQNGDKYRLTLFRSYAPMPTKHDWDAVRIDECESIEEVLELIRKEMDTKC